MRDDPFDLARFVAAQDLVFETACAELRAGRKRSHWMWFIFPQLRGLGHSAMAQHYGIASLGEARAYLGHPLLAERLDSVTQIVLGHHGRCAHDIFGSPDDMKFRSCMTLFDAAAGDADPLFRQALERYFDGRPDEATLACIQPQ